MKWKFISDPIYIYIVQIAKNAQVMCLLSTCKCQITDPVECLVVFARLKQTQDLCVSLLFVQYRYILQYITQNGTFTRQNTLSFIILKLIPVYTLELEVHVCNKVILIDSFKQAGLAQWVEHQTSDLRVVGWSSTVGKNFSFCNMSLSTRSWQVNWSHTNEIKHDVHLRYIGCIERMVIWKKNGGGTSSSRR